MPKNNEARVRKALEEVKKQEYYRKMTIAFAVIVVLAVSAFLLRDYFSSNTGLQDIQVQENQERAAGPSEESQLQEPPAAPEQQSQAENTTSSCECDLDPDVCDDPICLCDPLCETYG